MSDERHQQRQQRLKEQVDARRMSAELLSSSPATAKAKPLPPSVRRPAPSVTGKR